MKRREEEEFVFPKCWKWRTFLHHLLFHLFDIFNLFFASRNFVNFLLPSQEIQLNWSILTRQNFPPKPSHLMHFMKIAAFDDKSCMPWIINFSFKYSWKAFINQNFDIWWAAFVCKFFDLPPTFYYYFPLISSLSYHHPWMSITLI